MKPIRRNRKFQRFSTYDMEWVPGSHSLQIRVIGCHDGEKFCPYYSIDSFLRNQLTPKNSGTVFYAHAGGLYDVQFVFEKMIEDDSYYTTACFSASSAIIVDVRKGRHHWRFLDSAWLLKGSLKEIGEWLGEYKTGPADSMTEEEKKDWYANVPLPELTDYCEQDCYVLYKAISEFRIELYEIGGDLKCTLASTSLDLFLRNYLKTELPCNVSVNLWSREAYTASRVEVFKKKVTDCLYYDINSSFPFSMTKLMPGKIRYMGNRLPDEGPYLADVEIEVPECHIPPLPYRVSGRVFFPTGRWRGYLFWPDIETLLQAGGKILKVGDVIVFEPFWDLAQFANDLYNRRVKSGGFKKQVYKILLNSLYGKFAESPLKQKLHVHPPPEILQRLRYYEENPDDEINDGRPVVRSMITPGCFIETVEANIKHQHVALSGAITAWSRRALYDYMVQADDCFYCDTDGFAVPVGTTYATGDVLGDLKLEKVVTGGATFASPKVYSMEGIELSEKDKKKGKDTTLYKAKGFTLRGTSHEKEEKFRALMEGREIEITRMARLRENLAKGIIQPWERIVKKRFHKIFEKRLFYKDGSSRPWSVEELKEKL